MRKSKENILITRELSDDSPLWNLADENHHVIAKSFLEIIPIALHDIPVADIYFYYSKNAAFHFVQASKNSKIDLSKSQHAAMGKGTARMLSSLDLQLDFVGSDSPSIVAQKLLEYCGDKKICFVRARESTLSVQSKWPHEYKEAIIYDTIPKKIEIKEEIHTIIATSPKSLTAALNCTDINVLQRIICIGPTTLSAANKLTSVNSKMALTSSEEALYQAYL